MANILVTGANGTIGNATVRALCEAGKKPRAGVRNIEKGAPLRALGAEVVSFDFSDPQGMRRALDGVEGMLLVTPFVEDSVPLVKAALAAAKDAGVAFILRLSGLGADPDSSAPLARQHGIGERILHESDIASSTIRSNFFMDNFINFAGTTIKNQQAIYGAAGAGKVAFVSSRDVGQVAAAILSSPAKHTGRRYELTGPAAIDHHEAARTISSTLGREVRYVDLTAQQLEASLRQQGVPDFAVQGLMFLEHVKAQGWAATVTPAVGEITGRAAEPFEAFVRREAKRLAS
ncbi:MAG TPA: SDR family oxidoreductase [Polyangiaceae bacterium]|nr:SDR family oxidoreductase [Polyangiaceae bacterium]